MVSNGQDLLGCVLVLLGLVVQGIQDVGLGLHLPGEVQLGVGEAAGVGGTPLHRRRPGGRGGRPGRRGKEKVPFLPPMLHSASAK